MLAEEPIKLEQVNKSLVFGARSLQVSLSSPFPFPFLLLLPSRLFIAQERDLEQVHYTRTTLIKLSDGNESRGLSNLNQLFSIYKQC